ncbi:phosphoadenosine phosphosulfate reductase family protein [Halobacteriovorax sp. RT-2-6]|uniref:phosphoadenosine phosphosulfate reductase domain-containing protein n=1 Tax=unclassified Halobacteriovorax TaxID=2639665 RepID=UPI00399AE80E
MSNIFDLKDFKYDPTRRQICPLSGGKDSTALAILLKGKIPNLEYVFTDTGAELPEAYEYLDKLEAFLGQPIIRLNSEKTFDYLLQKNGNYLPSARARWCTAEMKIKSYEKFVGDDLIESYVGIRADENREGYISDKDNIKPRYPFKEYGIDLDGVNQLLEESGIGMPKYYEWRSRSGCYFCFFQRQIEWVGLKERHPDLFEKAKEYEKRGYVGEGRNFTWVNGTSLEEMEARADEIKQKHEDKMAKAKAKACSKKDLSDIFKDVVNDDDGEDSCLICDL